MWCMCVAGTTVLGRHLSTVDSKFGSLFSDQTWRDAFDRAEYSSTTGQYIEQY